MLIRFDESVLTRLCQLDPDKDLDAAHDAWLELRRFTDNRDEAAPARALFFRTKRRGLDERRRRKLGKADALARRIFVDDSIPSAETRVIQTENLERVAVAVGKLPLRFQAVLVMRYWHDLSPADIANRLSVPLKTVYSRLAKARSILAFSLTDCRFTT